ncbi:hypothetical protein ODS41_03295 [Pyrobaculum sp. 3827-6]|uniref:hypothetical protein n=2 Tax=unclassified Pyrobaculum TaxID=2643434 RepID=UPI0021DAFEB5|nr:hypothetical protein [Pyrobaculum sp. 3827-6]MCU7786954.1 hypothetical protein [Pyrobaculum sp. 3827-6]
MRLLIHSENVPTVLAIDFSKNCGAMGAGVVVFRGSVVKQSEELAMTSHRIGNLLAERGSYRKALKMAFWGIHMRETGKFLERYISSTRLFAVEKAYAVRNVESKKLGKVIRQVIRDYGEPIIFADKLDGDEASLLNEAGFEKWVEGKNYFVALSDVVAYYAMLLTYLEIKEKEQNCQVDKDTLRKRIEKLDEILKNSFEDRLEVV